MSIKPVFCSRVCCRAVEFTRQCDAARPERRLVPLHTWILVNRYSLEEVRGCAYSSVAQECSPRHERRNELSRSTTRGRVNPGTMSRDRTFPSFLYQSHIPIVSSVARYTASSLSRPTSPKCSSRAARAAY